MSLSTRCPACGTTFRVAQDQLRMSDGWVRCGRCSRVFDGNEGLQETASASEMAPPAAVATPSTFDFPDFATFPDPSGGSGAESGARTTVEAGESRRQLTEARSADEEDAAHEASGAQPVPAPWLGHWPSLDLAPVVEAAAAGAGPSPDRPSVADAVAVDAAAPDMARAVPPEDVEAPFDVARASALAEPAAPASSETQPAAADHGGFTTLERRDGPVMRWLRRLPGLDRLPLRAISAGALVLLAAQSIYQSRDAIAARRPALRPALAAMCSVGGCEVSALRRIEAIAIDGASFARDPGGAGFQLTFTLRNRDAVPLAMPAIELTLLDTREQAVIRRVLMPADFGAPDVLPAHAERSVLLPLAVSSVTALAPVAGYGVAAFYP